MAPSPSITFLFTYFFFNDTATTEIYTLSLHDALPIYLHAEEALGSWIAARRGPQLVEDLDDLVAGDRSEEHTSELQSLAYLVCRLLLEKKKHTMCLACMYVASTPTRITRSLYASSKID